MSELQQIQEQLQTRLPDAEYTLIEATPPQIRELRIFFDGNQLIITI